MENQDPILAIGSEFSDEEGNKKVPFYTKDPKTGMLSTNLIQVGVDSSILGKKQSLEKDLGLVVEDIHKNGDDPDAIEHYRQELSREYGQEAAAKLDETLGLNLS